MKTAIEIFDQYFNHPSVVTNQAEFERLVMLPAMEEYASLMARHAFEAARKADAEGKHQFSSFEEYQHSLKQPKEPEDELRTTLEQIGEMLLPQYIPSNPAAQQVSFTFNAEGSRYEVTYVKDAEGYWVFSGYESAT